MRRAIYPGSFDPVTNGHLDVIERARKLFDEVVVAVAHNDEKQPLFSLEQRLDLLQETAGRIENVRIAEFSGLLVEFARAQNAGAVIRGLRAVSILNLNFKWRYESKSECRGRNDIPNAEGGIYLSQLAHRKGNRQARRECLKPLFRIVWPKR
jgi:cytidyltransferase-like protein